jgi:hypothetical protein
MLCLSLWHTLAYAQCNVTISCGGPPLTCSTTMCFVNETAKKQFEQQHNCKFATKNLCGGRPIDDTRQCCGKDAASGKAKIKERQANKLDPKFNWATYQKECPNMRQSEGKPDALWNQCVIGEKQSPADDYPIVQIIKNEKTRPHCIDGCSTPPTAVSVLYALGIFLVKDKDNPNGIPTSSFFSACAQHDICYQTCAIGSDQSTCDKRLLEQSLQACETIDRRHTSIDSGGNRRNTYRACRNAANKMNTGLSLAGASAFSVRKQQYCQCCNLTN